MEIGPGEAAFAPLRGERAPRKLPQVPKFFPKGNSDQIFDGLHNAVQKEMLEGRADRIKTLLQKADTPAKREAVKNAIKQRMRNRN
ncbi:MAG TPA: hypothetical protein VEC06_07160 [Paucimonas sp.]|nr:hypothetical protein [Paucimonas sp.]